MCISALRLLRAQLDGRMLIFNNPTLALAYGTERQLLAWKRPVAKVPAEGVAVLLPHGANDYDISEALAKVPQVTRWEVKEICGGCPRVALSPRR